MPNNCLSVLYKRIIQVENKNVGLKVGGHKHTIAPQPKKWGAQAPLAPSVPAFCVGHVAVRYRGDSLCVCVYVRTYVSMHACMYVCMYVCIDV